MRMSFNSVYSLSPDLSSFFYLLVLVFALLLNEWKKKDITVVVCLRSVYFLNWVGGVLAV